MLNIKKFIITTTLITIIASSTIHAKTSQTPTPNILFIAIDDLNDYVNCLHGSIQAKTPNIDRLASQGVLFTNAHCQAPICGPSRACIMTGLYPSTSGNYLQLKDKEIKKADSIVKSATFLPDYLEKYNYKTMAVGKIYHQGDKAKTFDLYGGKFDWFGPKPKKRMNYDPSKIPTKTGHTQTDWGAFPEKDNQMTDYKSANWAINQLQQKHNKPFLLAVGFLRPHVPWHVPQKWFDMFPLDKIKTPPYNPNDYNDIPQMAQRVANAPMMPTTNELIKNKQWKKALQAYLACIAFVDAQVGKVLNALEKSPYANNTIIVLYSDHGYHLGEKNRFAKQALWERDTHTILIFKPLHAKGGQRCNAPVQLVDIYPTLLDLCHLPPYKLADGHSLAPLLKNPQAIWNHPALTFYGEHNISIRDYRYRLTCYEDNSKELYDLTTDPNEWHNLANNPKYKTIISKLSKQIPKKWASLSKYSKYNFNPYFTQKSKEAQKRK